jgi:hypothetical protein
MKRSLLACGLCLAMLLVAVFVFMPTGIAKSVLPGPQKENVIESLLSMPAPPPPNPLEPARTRDESFFDPQKPPADDAPIEDLVDYWTSQSGQYRGSLYYLPRPSLKVIERLLTEGRRSLPELLNVLPDDTRTADLVSGIYNDPSTPEEARERLKDWLLYNSSVFSDQLTAKAQNVRDANDYVNALNENSLLALTRHDWDAARPIVESLYNDSTQPVSKALATWGLYRHAMESGDAGDTDRYRTELMRMVEDRSLPDGVRDMANDAIVREPDFPGRDEWCWSLFEDETLVNMQRFTGLTTLMMYQPPDKYVPKMIEFLKSSNKTVRLMAARNLLTVMDRTKDPGIIRALLPWLEDPKWLDVPDGSSPRMQMVIFLSSTKMPESVPGLIAALDEKAMRETTYGPNANVMANAANTMSNMVFTTNANTNRWNSRMSANTTAAVRMEAYYPLREYAVRALAMQADPRAVSALRRVLQSAPDYQRNEVIRALFACGGFSIPEQVNALEDFARSIPPDENTPVNFGAFTNTSNISNYEIAASYASRFSERADRRSDVNFILGAVVAGSPEPSELLAGATIDRIEELSKKDPQTSQALRRIIIGWKGLAISSLLLRDLKNGDAGSDAIVRLLTERKLLREKLFQDVSDARSGTPVAAGVASCILGDAADHEAVINSKNVEARTALYACARLVRAALPLARVSGDLRSTDQNLKTAAELYLESEDSAEARNIVLSQFPNEARILGATSCFPGTNRTQEVSPALMALFVSASGREAGNYLAYDGRCAAKEVFDAEEPLQKEVKDDQNLMGLYAYKGRYVRIFRDKVVFSWQDDPARYHERTLKAAEFDALKQLMISANAGELKPFLACTQACGDARELLMLGRQGGRRVFVRSDREANFFSELEKLFAAFGSEPADLKYSLSKEVPGLEILFASDDLDAQTVWKQGGDLRVVVSNKVIRQKVENEISVVQDSIEIDDDVNVEPDKNGPPIETIESMRSRRQYEGFSWFEVMGGKLGSQRAQPLGFEYIPQSDGLQVQPSQQSWKARGPGFEIRRDDSGVYKVAAGKMVPLLKGFYNSPVVSADGRWLAASKFEESEGPTLVRYDLISKREYKVPFEGYGMLEPRCFVPAIGRFLLTAGYDGEDDEGLDEDGPALAQQADAMAHRYYLLDAATGALIPAFGELRPLIQQTFRPLQSTAKANEFWAALVSGQNGKTAVGLYDARSFRFTPKLQLPRISFSSMDMWVDQSEGKVYFVYNGHLLSVPLQSKALSKP